MVFFYLVTHFITWMHFHYVWDFSLGISHIRLYHIVFSSLAAVESIADALVWLSLLLLCSSNDVTYAGASPLQSFNCCGKCCWWSSWAIVWGTKRLCYLPAFVKGVWGPLEGSWDLCAGLNEGRKPFIIALTRFFVTVIWVLSIKGSSYFCGCIICLCRRWNILHPWRCLRTAFSAAIMLLRSIICRGISAILQGNISLLTNTTATNICHYISFCSPNILAARHFFHELFFLWRKKIILTEGSWS